MRISGNENEMIPVNSGPVVSARYTPSGNIKVQDNSINQALPLINVRVKARRWFKLGKTFTDVNGNFSINKSYRDKATVLVKMKNNNARVRGINGALKIWQYVFPVKKNLGKFTTSQMQNVDYTFQPSTNANSKEAMQWVAAHAINALWKSKTFNSSEGITNSIPDLNIWVSPKITSDASTPMLRYTADNLLIVQVVDVLAAVVSTYTNFPATQIVSLLKSLAPDVTLNYVSNDVQRTSEQLNNTFLHELGHSVHYAQVGSSYWASYITYVIQNDYGYGEKTTAGSERIAVAEGWGYFIGNYYTNRIYRSLSTTGFQIGERNLVQLENQVPNDIDAANVPSFSSNSSGWVIFGLFHDAMDIGEPAFTGVNDAVNGFNVSGLYNSLPASVNTVAGFRQELLNRSPSQSTQINQLFQSYRY